MGITLSQKNIVHIIVGATIGNIAEWYNFLLYGYLAAVISQLFFPLTNQLASLILTFGVFALSFLVRPLGALLFGWLGDTYGRQYALIVSLAMMAIPTFLIGILPTYQTIGVASPILLGILRIAQGLSAGGEHTGSAVYIAEHAPIKQRVLWLSMVPMSAALGILLSSVVALLIVKNFTQAQLFAWGWRSGYWLGALLCLSTILLRINLPETPYFIRMQKMKLNTPYSITKLIKNIKLRKNLLVVFGLASSWGIFYQILFVWMPTYLTQMQNFSNSAALQINCFFIFVLALLIVGCGYCADKIKRKYFLVASCIAFIVASYPLFLLLSSGSLGRAYIAIGVFTFMFSLYIPSAFVSMVEAFTTEIRYTGLSFGFNMGLAIFGGTAPLVVTGLIKWMQNPAAPAFYLIFAAIIALLISF